MITFRKFSLLSSLIGALLVWWFIPDTFIDRSAFSLSIRPFSASPAKIKGNGTDESPYSISAFKNYAPAVIGKLPSDIIITDDPDQIFNTSPPSPLDFAIILKNLRRLGQKSIAIGMPLSWESPETIPLTALDLQLDAVPRLITSAPLSRGTIASPIPQAFRRASIPISKIRGNTTLIPIVNRVPIPDILLGTKSSLAGFTTLESEPEGKFPNLLAKWEDRIVFSFALLAAMEHLKIPPSSVNIHLGQYIRLGNGSNYIPIDIHGRLRFSPPSLAETNTPPIPAETLVDAPNKFLAGHFSPILIRNKLSSADAELIRFSESLSSTVAMLSNPSATFSIRYFPRFSRYIELVIIAAFLILIFGIKHSYPGKHSRAPLAILGGSLIIIHFCIVPITTTWPPTLPILTAITIAFILTKRKTNKLRTKRPTGGKRLKESRQAEIQI